MRPHCMAVAIGVVAAAFASSAFADVSTLTVNRCLAGKVKAVGKAAAAQTSCSSKEASSDIANPACHATASAKLAGGSGTFAKLELKYPNTSAVPCLTFSDASTVDGTVTSFVGNVTATTGTATGKCDAAKIRCVGKYVSTVMGCAAKAAAKTADIDPGCTGKAAAKLANNASGCLDRAAAAGDCSNAGSQATGLRTGADDFVEATLCALDPANPGCEPPPPRFVDNGDGTVTDLETGLQWEQKTGSAVGFTDCSIDPCPDPHAATNAYQWCADADHIGGCDDIYIMGFPVWPPNGNAYTEFLPALSGFAGHVDWRLPTVEELQTILAAPFICGTHPCIDPVFGPTASARYWSDTDYIQSDLSRENAWFVDFDLGHVNLQSKTNAYHVRAVRGP